MTSKRAAKRCQIYRFSNPIIVVRAMITEMCKANLVLRLHRQLPEDAQEREVIIDGEAAIVE
jgi:hypothetical protein